MRSTYITKDEDGNIVGERVVNDVTEGKYCWFPNECVYLECDSQRRSVCL